MLKRAIASFSGRKLLKFSSNLFLIRFTFWNLFQLLETHYESILIPLVFTQIVTENEF